MLEGQNEAAHLRRETPEVADLEDFGAGDLAVAGGKGANLGELLRIGLPVPAGFIISTAGFASMLDDTGLGSGIRALLDGGAAAHEIRAAVGAVAVPAPLAGKILAAYRRLGSGPVAVRSSATAEDLPGAAFAGQQDTFLNVSGEAALLKAVAACWASLWTDRAMAYRARRGIDERGLAMAVVVQEMVPAEVAGVMFSADPVTGRRDRTVLDAAAGLGESVVSGLVTPEHYVLDASGRLRDWSPGGAETVVEAESGGGTRQRPGTVSVGRILGRARLAELAGISRRATEHFGTPQDMEWAVAGDKVLVLQSRPMTALPPEPVALNPLQRRVGPFFIEMFQERPYPLDVSGWLRFGIVGMLQGMAGSIGVRFPSVAEMLPEEDGVVHRLVVPSPRPTLKTLAAPFSVIRRARRHDPATWRNDPRFAAFLAEIEELDARDLGALDWAAVVSFARRTLKATDLLTDLRVSYLPGAFLPQLGLRAMLLVLGKHRLAPALIAGAETQTSRANAALEQLAALARNNAELARAFATLSPQDLLLRLAEGPGYAGFNRRLAVFLREYGHRETVSLVLSSSPTWIDAPAVVLGLVKMLLVEPPATTNQTGEALESLLRHRALRGRRLRTWALGSVEAARRGMGFRQDSHFYLTMALPPLRRALLELGARLRSAGVLDEAHAVFHLRLEELASIDGGGSLAPGEAARWHGIVRARSAKREELAGVPLLDLDAAFAPRAPEGNALLRGTPASRGTATGTVRLIRGPEGFGELRAGEILVCPYTNPSWTPLFQRAAAVVVDTGGLGSHTAIVAREYGIPAVMGTRTGTKVLADGDRVTVDGGTGRITAAGEGP